MQISTQHNLNHQVLVEPDPASWITAIKKRLRTNPQRDSNKTNELVNLAHNYTSQITGHNLPPTQPPYLVTGHQANWHHCGILAKAITGCKLANKLQGTCLNLIVDHDAYDTSLRIPVKTTQSQWHLRIMPTTSQNAGLPVEFQFSTDTEKISQINETIIHSHPDSLYASLFRQCNVKRMACELARESISDLISIIISKLHLALDLKMLYLPVSRLGQSHTFHQFACSIMENAKDFASSYNVAIQHIGLNDPLNRHNLPKPLNVQSENAVIELPFWLSHKQEGRQTLHIGTSQQTITIFAGSAPVAFLDNLDLNPATLAYVLYQRDLHLRPKAVTLTLFTRLFLADCFLHGTGGQIYEEIGDFMLEHYFHRPAAPYGTATCHMTLPGISDTELSKSVSHLRSQLHHMKHNPESFLTGQLENNPSIRELIKKKQQLVQKACNQQSSQMDRHQAWLDIKGINLSLRSYLRALESSIQDPLDKLESSSHAGTAFKSRELFFGFFPKDDLHALIETCPF